MRIGGGPRAASQMSLSSGSITGSGDHPLEIPVRPHRVVGPTAVGSSPADAQSIIAGPYQVPCSDAEGEEHTMRGEDLR